VLVVLAAETGAVISARQRSAPAEFADGARTD
jgi:hypothetical protein